MKRNKIIMAVCLIAAVCSFQVFAAGSAEGNDLWQAADKIADASESVLPVERTVVWEELNTNGDVANTSEFTIYYGETESSTFAVANNSLLTGQELSYAFTGDADAASMRSSVNDGLFWTPFDDGVDNSDKVNAEVKSMDLWVENTGITENVDGNECLVFEYSVYRDSGELGYKFVETVDDDYVDTESGIMVRTSGKVWIDGDGVPRQIESNIKNGYTNYKEVVKYDYDGSTLYPVESIIDGTLDVAEGNLVVQVAFRATETMSDYWTATDFYR